MFLLVNTYTGRLGGAYDSTPPAPTVADGQEVREVADAAYLAELVDTPEGTMPRSQALRLYTGSFRVGEGGALEYAPE